MNMTKISNILPENRRICSVDLDKAPPARPGSPDFGQPMGENTLKDRVSLSSAAKELFEVDGVPQFFPVRQKNYTDRGL